MPTASPQPSFIPREVPQAGEMVRTRESGLSDLFVLISVVLFVASGALAAGVFLYQQYLNSSDTSKVDQLERAKAAFEPSLIQELTRLDDRMRSAGDVLGKHIAPSVLFRMLEASTITTVAFSALDFQATDSQHMTIKMSGVADSVNSIALQADLFSKGGMIVSPIFSNINRESDGVHFNLTALVNPASINYAQLVSIPAPASVQDTPASPFDGSENVPPQTRDVPPEGAAPQPAAEEGGQ